MLHYSDQFRYQIYRVLGSIDVLGNPIGLFHTLSSGFGELFYEPYQGFIMSDRPQDLGIGIAKVRDRLCLYHE
jgi:vacuolar protein sorting-associated protein 13A/C